MKQNTCAENVDHEHKQDYDGEHVATSSFNVDVVSVPRNRTFFHFLGFCQTPDGSCLQADFSLGTFGGRRPVPFCNCWRGWW